MEERVASLLNEIRQRLELLESNLLKRVEGMAVSRRSKLPYKVWFAEKPLSGEW